MANSSVRAVRAKTPARGDKLAARPKDAVTSRNRRGKFSYIPSSWRRCELGTNRISCIGIWRKGSRRKSPRANRTGDTDWHRPYRGSRTMMARSRESAT